MLKKVIPIVISLCLIFSISVMAENEIPATEETVTEVSEQIPQGAEEQPQGVRGNMGTPPSGDMQGRTPPTMPNGKITREGMNRGQKPSGEFTPPQNTEFGNTKKVSQSTSAVEESAENKTSTDEQNNHNTEENPQFGGRMPGGMKGGFPGNMQSNSGQTQEAEPKTFWGFVKTYSTPIASVILLALAFIFVIFYRRKNY
ncbi:MAG: hypothetical protein IKI97_06280 [Clostridia bacterium]|nr:hypothetical protein [Clostridia bacterium]